MRAICCRQKNLCNLVMRLLQPPAFSHYILALVYLARVFMIWTLELRYIASAHVWCDKYLPYTTTHGYLGPEI